MNEEYSFNKENYISSEEARINIFNRLNENFDMYDINSFLTLGNDAENILSKYQASLTVCQNDETLMEVNQVMKEINNTFEKTLNDIQNSLIENKKVKKFLFFKKKKKVKDLTNEDYENFFNDIDDEINNIISKKEKLNEISETLSLLKDSNLEMQDILQIYLSFIDTKIEEINFVLTKNENDNSNEALRKKELLFKSREFLIKRKENLFYNFEVYQQLIIQNDSLIVLIIDLLNKIDTLKTNFSVWKNIISLNKTKEFNETLKENINMTLEKTKCNENDETTKDKTEDDETTDEDN